MKKRMRLISILLCLCMILSLAACGSSDSEEADATGDGTTASDETTSTEDTATEDTSSDSSVAVELTEPVTIQFWFLDWQENVNNTMQELVDNFNSTTGAEMGITVEMTTHGGMEDLEPAVTAAIKAGNAPNVTMCQATSVVDWLQADAVVDLTPYINDADYGIDLSDYYDVFVKNSSSYPVEGYYSLPQYVSGEVMYYNVDFFEENGLTVPTTWEEFEEVARQCKEITGKPVGGWDDALKCFTTLIQQAGVGYTDSEGNLLFTEDMDTVKETISWWDGLVQEGIVRTPGEDYYFSGPFANSVVPLYIGSGNEGDFIDMKIPEDNQFEWSCAPIPTFADGTNADYSEGYLISMLDTNAEPDLETRWASWIFIQYLQSAESCAKISDGVSLLPFLKSVAESDDFKANASPAQIAGTAQMEYFYTYPGFITDAYTSDGLQDYIRVAMGNILDNGADVSTELDSLVSTLQ